MLPLEIIAGFGLLLVVAITVLVLRRGGNRHVPRSEYSHRFDVSELAGRLDVPLERLQQWNPEYRTVTMPKRSGGHRELLVPDEETKWLQRRILQRLLKRLNAHPLACGFEEHTSVVDAAIPHVCRAAVVKMDVKNFFASTTADRIQRYLEGIGWDTDAARLLTRLTTTNGGLPMGAPTSPRLSNLVNAPLDAALLKLAKRHAGVYTRYADDLNFSFDHDDGLRLRRFIQQVRLTLRRFGYQMHTGKKLQILRRHQQQRVLGLVVNHRVALPRKTRRWLRSVRHRMKTGGRSSLNEAQLAGWTAYEQMVERQREG